MKKKTSKLNVLNVVKGLGKALDQPTSKKILTSQVDDGVMVMRKRSIDLDSALEDWIAVCKNLFPKATSVGGMLHAKKECDEVIEILNPEHKDHSKSLLSEEYADILMCIFDSVERAGIDITEVVISIRQKTQVNKERKWKYNGDGSYSHIK